MKYRTEIDGLRCIAVVPVILFHAGASAFSGGYVGVDVFFVISGYLITGILADEMASGRFSLIGFYERRARRILPALFVIMALCIPFAWAWMLPSEMLNFSRSIVAVIIFSSNVLFYLQAGYFAPRAEEFPLLHTWSLAVEEQFYIALPILLLFAWRFGRKIVMLVVSVLALVSLALCVWLITPEPEATFYLIHTRAWELFAGSLLALWQLRSGDRAVGKNDLGAALGLAAIIYSILVFDKETPFPSQWTLLPVGGTLMILHYASRETGTARILSLRPVVWIGLISYSAYLIHQPLFAFARIRSIGEPDDLLVLGLAFLTFPLAWISWRFVEQPFRHRERFDRKRIFLSAAVGISVFCAAGLAGHFTRGFPQRMDAEVRNLAIASLDQNPRMRSCFRGDLQQAQHPIDACLTDGSPFVALVGDSHNNALAAGLHPALDEAGYGVYEISRPGCIPIPGLRRENDVGAECHLHNVAVQAWLNEERPDIIVLTARWTKHLLGTSFDNGEGGIEPDDGRQSAAVDLIDGNRDFNREADEERQQRVLGAIRAQILEMLEHSHVVLMYPVPEVGWDLPVEAATARMQGETREFSTSYELYRWRNSTIIGLFDSIEHRNLARIRPANILCDTDEQGRCTTILDGHPLYRDDNHLSRKGADLLSREVISEIANISAHAKD